MKRIISCFTSFIFFLNIFNLSAQCPNPVSCSSSNGDIVNIKLGGLGGTQTFATFTYTSGTSLFKKPYSMDGTFNSYSTNNLSLQTNGTTRMTIFSSSGNVGIGTTTPSNMKLDVNGNIGVNGALCFKSGTNFYPNIEYINSELNFRLGPVPEILRLTSNTTYINNQTNISGGLQVTGNMGIGITATEKLDVNGNLKLRGKSLYLQNNNGEFSIQNNSCSNDLVIKLFGCGGLKTAARITYEGKIECQEILVKSLASNEIKVDRLNLKINGVADYVFEENYDLNSLEEVEEYIKINKHLPGVPSGAELEEKGMDVATMNNLLLQKIEELTLYIIQLKKDNEELKKKMKEF